MAHDIEHEEFETPPTFEDALAELSADDGVMPSSSVLYGLSNLSNEDLQRLAPVWQGLDANYRRILMQMLVDASESDFELNYQALAHVNLNAHQAEVRQAAIELLWEDETITHMDTLLKLAQHDPALNVRAEAIKSLGSFVLLGELKDLEEFEIRKVQDALLAFFNNPNEPIEIRRYALESLANSSLEEVNLVIHQAYASDDDNLRVGAVVAMGRSCDADRWGKSVLKELGNQDEDIRREAIRAAGELQLEDAVRPIIRLVDDDDRETLEAIIWALGEIGGKAALDTLNKLAEAAEDEEDDDLIELIDDAVTSASIAGGDWSLMDFGHVE